MKNLLFSLLMFVVLFCSCALQTAPVQINSNDKNIELTLMIYMAADNDLETYALQNLKAMEHAFYRKMNVIVLLDRAEGYDETDGNWTDTRLYEVVHDDTDSRTIRSKRLSCPALGLSANSETELDMSNPTVLRTFCNFSINTYKAKKYALILWGHGTGWRAFAIDDRSSGYMSVSALGQTVSNLDLSVIGFDTCFGGVLENLYELKDCAEYSVACPGVTPACGWNYTTLLESMTAGNFDALSIANSMAQSAAVSTTVLRNSRIGELMNSFESFSHALSDSIADSDDRLSVFNDLFAVKAYSYTQYPCDMYLDIYEMADLYSSYPDVNLSQTAENLKSKLRNCAISSQSQYAELGVHFIPLTSGHTTAAAHSADYIKNQNISDQCRFIKESRWWVPTVQGNSGSLLDKIFYEGV